MTGPSNWDAATASAACPIICWCGSAWRIHRRQYLATDFGGSLVVSGRYHRARDQLPPDLVWPALYLALSPETCLGDNLIVFPSQLRTESRITFVGGRDPRLHVPRW